MTVSCAGPPAAFTIAMGGLSRIPGVADAGELAALPAVESPLLGMALARLPAATSVDISKRGSTIV